MGEFSYTEYKWSEDNVHIIVKVVELVVVVAFLAWILITA